MPFTAYHLGPAILFGLALSAVFDLPTLLLASVIPDIEPACVLAFDVQGYPLHGFFHSYLGASILALFAVGAVVLFGKWISKAARFFQLDQQSALSKIVLTSFFGVYLHVFLDSFLYVDIAPFYPLQANPFISMLSVYDSSKIIYAFCSVTGILGIAFYWYKLRKGNTPKSEAAPSKQSQAKEFRTEKGDKQAAE